MEIKMPSNYERVTTTDNVHLNRIMDAVYKALEWEDGEITGVKFDKLEKRLKAILRGGGTSTVFR